MDHKSLRLHPRPHHQQQYFPRLPHLLQLQEIWLGFLLLQSKYHQMS